MGRTGSGHHLRRALDVGLREIVALEQERCACRFGVGIDETVAKVEASRMASTFAVTSKGLERHMGGFRLNRLNGDARQAQELHDVRLGVLDREFENTGKS